MTHDMPIPVFLSYAQIDDDGLGFVDAFRKDLRYYCAADHNRAVEVFYDRASLGWGDGWRESISAAVDGALVFLPLVTLTYFDRPWCRDELLQFYSSAHNRDVDDLLLPVVVLGHSHITPDSQDAAVRVIAERQQFDFREAAIAGPGTAVWRATMMRLAGELVATVDKAEPRLAPAPVRDREAAGRMVRGAGGKLIEATVALTDTLATFVPELEGAAAAAHGGDPRAIAGRLAPGGRALEHRGLALQDAAVELDGHLRAFVGMTMATGTPAERDRLRAELAQLGSGTPELDGMAEMCARSLGLLRPLELGNVALRQALAPLRIGFRAVGTAVGIMRAWTELGR
ncbi:toll/interleukin-1 receptor domain-containing protein [Actinokineospora guangxiensis]|uniref:Toll/interleukin-1 receptor domain-containing protein n=1 Tax=Actinokineospora guangxiensis TaxID=1490288 RepID=A0ABW0EFF6_9PSEU